MHFLEHYKAVTRPEQQQLNSFQELLKEIYFVWSYQTLHQFEHEQKLVITRDGKDSFNARKILWPSRE